MTAQEDKLNSDRRTGGTAFLLAQVGAQAARRFGERISTIGLAPADAGLLRKIAFEPGISQQALAAHMGVMPSRMVALVDDLEARDMIERRRSAEDRRNYALMLTSKGREILEKIRSIAEEHEEDFCAPLSKQERATLAGLLGRIGQAQGLTPGVHPGYRTLGQRKRRR